jgi:hypothetical protein
MVLRQRLFSMIRIAPDTSALSRSQVYGLNPDVFISLFEGAPRHDIYPDTQEFFEILEQADLIEKGGAGLEVHK